MKGELLPGTMVEIDARTPALGGSWLPAKKKKNRLHPVAFNNELIQFFLDRMLEYDEPIVVDIGASTGSFSLLPVLHPRARITAFEANPDVAELLQINLNLNGIADRVDVISCALADYIGYGQLKVPKKAKNSGLACLGTPQRFKKWKDVEVDVMTLDSFSLDHVDLMKIDTEGCEWFVLQGAEKTIKRCKPEILLEFWQPNTEQFGYSTDRILRFLEYLGYTTFERLGKKKGDLWATI